MSHDIVRRERAAGPQHHREAYFLAKPPIGHRQRRCTRDSRVLHGEIFDPRRINVVTAANDQVFLAAGNLEITVLIDTAEVSGHEPAFSVERIVICALIVEVTQHEAGSAPADLPRFADRQFLVDIVLRENLDLVSIANATGGLHDRSAPSSIRV